MPTTPSFAAPALTRLLNPRRQCPAAHSAASLGLPGISLVRTKAEFTLSAHPALISPLSVNDLIIHKPGTPEPSHPCPQTQFVSEGQTHQVSPRPHRLTVQAVAPPTCALPSIPSVVFSHVAPLLSCSDRDLSKKLMKLSPLLFKKPSVASPCLWDKSEHLEQAGKAHMVWPLKTLTTASQQPPPPSPDLLPLPT